ncbi:hypothetical protein [Archangium lansingense]|uniref:Cytochrome c domain-containing protein n=1 Tax=Archangium lansingense TaxID=2995310 RepID=A0ABT4A9I4_9BACT|nr:hypothetical protein [Archangium lansinium]MCY1078308.1 hypothetical protein [Archangium lansinium]
MRQGLLFLLVVVCLVAARAEAFPWMIRHGYASCATCHHDPSGGALLTPYGRAQSELLLAARYGEQKEGEEVRPTTAFLLGAVTLPDWLNLGLSFRGGGLVTRAGDDTDVRPLQMVSDLRANIAVGPVRAGGSVGFVARGARFAALTNFEENNVVSREHWLGLANEDQTLLLRAGRMTLPFGLRTVEHTLWARQLTRTDHNEQQQHGVALAYNIEGLRTEVMAILGNFQLHPDLYRERGYSGYVEWAPFTRAAFGVSSLLTHARYDVVTKRPSFLRQAHGVFARVAPVKPLVFLLEADVLLDRPEGGPLASGYTGLLQVDYELKQGFHLLATAEVLQRPGVHVTALGGWLSFDYFILPQLEVRLDAILSHPGQSAPEPNVLSLLGQLRLSL